MANAADPLPYFAASAVLTLTHNPAGRAELLALSIHGGSWHL